MDIGVCIFCVIMLIYLYLNYQNRPHSLKSTDNYTGGGTIENHMINKFIKSVLSRKYDQYKDKMPSE